jgi:tetratricopeptide (TPR) repeat protein
MRNLIWLSMVAVLLAACGTAPAPQTTAIPAAPAPASNSSAVDLSVELNALQAGDTATAIAGLEQILANAPASAEAHLLLGQAYYRTDQKDKAEEQFLAAFTLNPAAAPPLESQDVDEWLQIGNAHASLNQLDEALAAYQAVLQIKPDKAAAYTNIGVVHYQAGQFDEAVLQMQKALEIDPGDAETHYMLGATYLQQQKLDEAEQSFNKAIELKPDRLGLYGFGNVAGAQGF